MHGRFSTYGFRAKAQKEYPRNCSHEKKTEVQVASDFQGAMPSKLGKSLPRQTVKYG